MKLTHRLAALMAVLLLILAACGGNKKASALIPQSARINTELNTLADDSPMFISHAGASYAEGTLRVEVNFCDTIVRADQLTDPLLQYIISHWLKDHAGANLDETLNTLGKEKGTLSVTITDYAGNEKIIVLPSSTLKRLATAKSSELPIAEARNAVIDILNNRCPSFAETVKAETCQVSYTSGFAQYNFDFKNGSSFAHLTPATLAGRYRAQFQPIYADYGACRPFVVDLLEGLQIDGYRIVYQADGKNLKTSLPWRLIN